MSTKRTQPEKRKPGPKPAITPEIENRLVDIVLGGLSIKDAAQIVGAKLRTVHRHKAENAEFGTRIKSAASECKQRLVRKVGKAKAWQAAAWLLERKWGHEFGRKDRTEHTGRGGGPIRQKTTVDFSNFSDDELLKFEQAATRRAEGIGEPSCN